MRAISFSWTSAALVAGHKTVTRRVWDERYAIGFHQGDMVEAFDRQPRYGGTCIARIRVQRLTYEAMSVMPDYDYEGEGHAFYDAHPEFAPKQISGQRVLPGQFSRLSFDFWRRNGTSMWVLRFSLEEIETDLTPVLQRAVELRRLPA
jgi:hypothetical protein